MFGTTDSYIKKEILVTYANIHTLKDLNSHILHNFDFKCLSYIMLDI